MRVKLSEETKTIKSAMSCHLSLICTWLIKINVQHKADPGTFSFSHTVYKCTLYTKNLAWIFNSIVCIDVHKDYNNIYMIYD